MWNDELQVWNDELQVWTNELEVWNDSCSSLPIESAEMSDSVDKFWLVKMKFLSRSSICLVALGNLSLYKVFIITISLSITGERMGELSDRERGRIEGDRRPSSSIKLGFESLEEKCRWCWNTCEWGPPGGVSCMDTGVPAGAWWPPLATAAAPSWCKRSWDEHWDCKWEWKAINDVWNGSLHIKAIKRVLDIFEGFDDLPRHLSCQVSFHNPKKVDSPLTSDVHPPSSR